MKNWNFYNEKKEKKYITGRLCETLFLWIAIGFLWLSFFHIVKEGYPQILISVDAEQSVLEEQIPPEKLAISYVEPEEQNPIEPEVSKEPSLKSSENIKLFWKGFGEILKNPKHLAEGFYSIADVYMQDWNAYYRTNYIVLDATGNYMSQTFFVITIIWWLVVCGNAYLLRKRIFYAFFPLGALIMQILVGRSPIGSGILYLFVGAMLLLSIERRDVVQVFGGIANASEDTNGKIAFMKKKIENVGLEGGISAFFTKMIALLFIVASLGVSGVLFQRPIEVLLQKKQDLLAWQQNLDIVSSIEAFFRGWDFQFSVENLNNRTPQYSGKVIFELEAEIVPESNLYFKGFYGTDYKNGTWNKDDSAFLKACKKEGYEESEMAQFLSYMPFSILHNANAYTSNSYLISYKESIGTTAYVPYVFDCQTLDEGYTFSGDYMVEKSLMDNYVSVRGIQRESMNALVWNMTALTEKDEIPKRKWYNRITENYKSVPKNMEVIAQAADEIEERMDRWFEEPYYSGRWGGTLDGITELEAVELDYAFQNNLHRINLSYVVAQYLDEIMSYSLVLENLPMGADPIEFAMTESKQGYCMHFASAATLLLRELGVPARYVSGYIARPSDFTWVEKEKIYKAEILDYHAHAWTEVYLDYIGWMPLEVTPGYDVPSGELPTQKNPEESDDLGVSTQETQQGETETQTETMTEEETQTETQGTTENSENETEGTELGGDIGASDGGQSGFWSNISEIAEKIGDFMKKYLPVILGILGLVLLFIGSVLGGKKLYAYYVNLLEEEIRKKQTRKAVKRINRRLYWYLRLRGWKDIGRVNYKTFNDAEFENYLCEVFTKVSHADWNTYMEIVKKMYYSQSELTEEEMMHCYKCYKKIFL